MRGSASKSTGTVFCRSRPSCASTIDILLRGISQGGQTAIVCSRSASLPWRAACMVLCRTSRSAVVHCFVVRRRVVKSRWGCSPENAPVLQRRSVPRRNAVIVSEPLPSWQRGHVALAPRARQNVSESRIPGGRGRGVVRPAARRDAKPERVRYSRGRSPLVHAHP